MGSVKEVADVAYDCKTATVTMRGEAVLSRRIVEEALSTEGFGLGELAEGPAPTFAVWRASLRPAAEDAAALPVGERIAGAELAAQLARDSAEIERAFVEEDGRLTLLVASGRVLGAEEIAAELQARGWIVEEPSSRRWPRSAAEYSVTLAPAVDAADAAATARARAAVEGIENVLGALACGLPRTLTVFTREPCANLESRLREALARGGFELGGVRAVETAGPAIEEDDDGQGSGRGRRGG